MWKSRLKRFRLHGVHKTGKEIGRGSYATVEELDYRGLKCAGKKLHSVLCEAHPSQADTQRIVERFETECRILSQANHPKIVQFLGVFFDDDANVPTLVMELMHTTVSQCLEQYGKLPETIAYNIMDDVATALCYLHGRNPPVLHRDLSANNVLLTADMRAKISDLGVAKILDLPVNQSICPGTLDYMPPEALSHNPSYDTSIDMFSYGVLLLHTLSAKWPTPTEPNRVDPTDKNSLIPLSEAERREEYFNDVGQSHPLYSLIKQCLCNYPPDRPNAREALEQLRKVTEGESAAEFDDMMVVLNRHKSEKYAMLEEAKKLWEDVQQLKSAAGVHKLALEQKQCDMQVLQAEIERLNSSLVAKTHEVAVANARVEVKNQSLRARDVEIAGKDQEIAAKETELAAKENELAAKDREIFAIQEESNSKDGAIKAKDAVVQRVLQNTEKILEHVTSSQGHRNILTPGTHIKWREGPVLPVEMTAPQCVTIAGKLYVGGGHSDRACYQLCIFHPELDQWQVVTCPVKYFGMGHLDGKLVIYGGCYPGNLYTSDGYELDEESRNKEWRIMSSMPTARARPCIVSSSFGIAVCGGVIGTGCIASVDVFLSATRQWQSTFPLPKPFALMRAVTVTNVCYLFGGTRPSVNISHTCGDCFYASVDDLFGTSAPKTPWETLPISAPVGSAPANLFGTLGAVGGTVSPQIQVYCPNTQQWVYVGKLPEPIAATSCLTRGMKLFLFGGLLTMEHNQRSNTFVIGTLERV